MVVKYRNNSALELVIGDSNSITKMARHIGYSLIIDVEYLVLRDDILLVKNKGILELETEGENKIVINRYNRKSNIPSFILLLIEDI